MDLPVTLAFQRQGSRTSVTILRLSIALQEQLVSILNFDLFLILIDGWYLYLLKDLEDANHIRNANDWKCKTY